MQVKKIDFYGFEPSALEINGLHVSVLIAKRGYTDEDSVIRFAPGVITSRVKSEADDECPIEIKVPAGLHWDDVWLAIFGHRSGRIPDWTAYLIDFVHHGNCPDIDAALLERCLELTNISMEMARQRRMPHEEKWRAQDMLKAETEVDDWLSWLNMHRDFDLDGYGVHLSESGVEILAEEQCDFNHGYSYAPFAHGYTVDNLIADTLTYRASLVSHLFYFYARRDDPDYSFIEKVEGFQGECRTNSGESLRLLETDASPISLS
ncbi:hypothetical protein AU381_23475 [Sinorhizobium glycinis]|uniref:Uncharacterized protein n=1 Tax=Sinorhizobium glycinis TaxID=1472378 RepID=A0A178XTB4_9HYPH|nr:hypothetical protein [Sinorhizobium glycinis]OAP38520.1 hypothetical protein AU381_23475 [Sinorhizobium glycinis]